MDVEIRRLLNSVNGSPVRVTTKRFAQLWNPPLSANVAILRMRDLTMRPPAGFAIEEIEGRGIVVQIRRK